MSALLLALALFAQDPAAAAPEPAAEPAPAEARWPVGAPRDEYQFVGWCYGALRGYLDLSDEVMPEVKRIETRWRRPGSNLAEDMKAYTDMEKAGRVQLIQFQTALTAAEKASLRPINQIGANAVRQGRMTWRAGPDVTPARKAQEWMSWTLPAVCETTAASLETRAKLMGATFQVNAEPEAPAPETPAPAAPSPQ